MVSVKLQIDILGWTVSILYLLGYALVYAKKTEGDSVLYQGLNVVAGMLLVIYWGLTPQAGLMPFGLRLVF